PVAVTRRTLPCNVSAHARSGESEQLAFAVLTGGIVFLAPMIVSFPARAYSAAEFYRNRQMTMLIGTAAGDGYDTFGRMIARHMGKYLPGGSAKFIVRNMPG